MPKITISYRRNDSTAITGRIYDRLAAHYGAASVFMDVTDIPTGIDYRVHIEETLQRSDVLLVVVGPRWLASSGDRPRIFEPSDPIRAELAAALRLKIPVLPVLIDRATMPAAQDLPLDVQQFAYINAAFLDSGRDFQVHFSRIVSAIDQIIGRRSDNALLSVASRGLANLKQRLQSSFERETEDARSALRKEARPAVPLPPAAQESALPRLPPIPSIPPNTPPTLERTIIAPAPTSRLYDRSTPEFWLDRVAVQRKLTPGDEPLVMMSYASEDYAWVKELRAFLDRRIEELREPDGRPYELWNFADNKRGTAPGDEFPEIVAEKMWRCRLAIVVLSKDYFSSDYCRTIELPFLMWRRGHHGLMCFPIKLGAVPVDLIRIPGYDRPSSKLRLEEIIDDRQAAKDFADSPHRDLSMKQLKERGLEAEIENRFDGLSRRVFDFLKTRYEAVERD